MLWWLAYIREDSGLVPELKVSSFYAVIDLEQILNKLYTVHKQKRGVMTGRSVSSIFWGQNGMRRRIAVVLAAVLVISTLFPAVGAQTSASPTPGSNFLSAPVLASGRYEYHMPQGGKHLFLVDAQQGDTLSIGFSVSTTTGVSVELDAPNGTVSTSWSAVGTAFSTVSLVVQKPGLQRLTIFGNDESDYVMTLFVTNFKILSAQWVGEVQPGDVGAMLTVAVRHDGSFTASGITAILNLTPAFSNTTGGSQVSQYYTSGVSPGQTVNFVFRLNVAKYAALGTQHLNLTLNYALVSGGGAIHGVPVQVTVTFDLQGRVDLRVAANTPTLQPGVVNNLFLVVGNFGMAQASSVDVTFVFPSSSTGVSASIIGSNHATVTSIQPFGNATIPLSIYVPGSLAGLVLEATVDLQYQDGYGMNRSVTRFLGVPVSVQGSSVQISSSWGSSNNLVEVGPGDVGADLSVAFQNVGVTTLSGLVAEMDLVSPFINSTGGHLVTSFYSGNVPPGQTANLQFSLNVKPTALVGSYNLGMTLNYLVVSNGLASQGSPITLTLPVLLTGKSQLTVNSSVNAVSSGSNSAVTITLGNTGSAAINNLQASLSFGANSPLSLSTGDSVQRFGNLLPNGSATYVAIIRASPSATPGLVQAVLSITYFDSYGQQKSDSRSIGIIVNAPETHQLVVSASGAVVTSGRLNNVTVTIMNQGATNINALTVTLGLQTSSSASATFSSLGQSNQWFFSQLPMEGNVSIQAPIYVSPTAAQGSYLIPLTLTYTDSSGATVSESRTVGLVVRQAVSPITVSLNDNTLTAGVVNNRSITINNNGISPIQSVIVTISNPSVSAGPQSSASSLVSLATGENRWYFNSIPGMGKIAITPQIFAAPGAIDNVYVVQVAISYTDSSNVPQTDTESISLAVQGLILIQTQDVLTSSATVAPGGNLSIVGNLLNSGNVPALYTVVNATSKTSGISVASEYVGEVDPNTLTPFSVTVLVGRNVQNGTQPITLRIIYKDSYNKTRMTSSSVNVVVGQSRTPNGGTQPSQQTLIAGVTMIGLVFFVSVAVVAVATVALFWRNRRATKRTTIGGDSKGVKTNVSAPHAPWE